MEIQIANVASGRITVLSPLRYLHQPLAFCVWVLCRSVFFPMPSTAPSHPRVPPLEVPPLPQPEP